MRTRTFVSICLYVVVFVASPVAAQDASSWTPAETTVAVQSITDRPIPPASDMGSVRSLAKQAVAAKVPAVQPLKKAKAKAPSSKVKATKAVKKAVTAAKNQKAKAVKAPKNVTAKKKST